MDEQRSPFVLPRTLDEVMVILAFVAWPFIFMFLLQPEDASPAGEAIAWVVAFAIEVGILFALRTARRGAASK